MKKFWAGFGLVVLVLIVSLLLLYFGGVLIAWIWHILMWVLSIFLHVAALYLLAIDLVVILIWVLVSYLKRGKTPEPVGTPKKKSIFWKIGVGVSLVPFWLTIFVVVPAWLMQGANPTKSIISVIMLCIGILIPIIYIMIKRQRSRHQA